MKLYKNPSIFFLFLVLLLLLIAEIPPSNCYLNSHFIHRTSTDNVYLTTKENWFDQTVDHFSPYDHRQFQQRYYEFLDNFRSPDGPIFLKICGEISCNGITNDYLSVLAKKFGAAIVSPEHRYYGRSSPFKTHTTENLKYLSSKQALFDLAAFRQFYQPFARGISNAGGYGDIISARGISNAGGYGDIISGPRNFIAITCDSLNRKLNRSNVENPWFVFGVSYSGALSAWFRLKFPHLTCGSLASSGVVQAIYNFTEFDQQIGASAGPECKSALQEVTQLVEKGLNSKGKTLKSTFGASELTNDGDFLYFLADAAVIAIQYGNPEKLCSPLVEAKKEGHDLVDTYASYVKDYFSGSFGYAVQTYNQEYLKNTTSGSSDRLWWFQVCSEVAYFQVAPANDSIRSSKVNTRYHLDLCKNVFGDGVYPKVDETNLYYGGTKIAGTKIVFTNGSQDPWRHASKETSSPDMPSYIITCNNCGHGTDLRGCPQSPLSIEGDEKRCSSPDAVKKVRQQVIEHIDLWLSECQGAARGWSSV